MILSVCSREQSKIKDYTTLHYTTRHYTTLLIYLTYNKFNFNKKLSYIIINFFSRLSSIYPLNACNRNFTFQGVYTYEKKSY